MMHSLKNSMIASGIKWKILFSFYSYRSSSQTQAVIKMLEKKTKTKDSLKTGGRYHCLIQIWKS